MSFYNVRPGYNKVIFCGYVSRPPEFRRTPQGVAVSTFSLTVPGTSPGQERREEMILEVVMFSVLAERWGTMLGMGTSVVVAGTLAQRRQRGIGGIAHSSYEVRARAIEQVQ